MLTASISRTGVLKYRNADGSERREYVPPEELFRADSMATLRTASLTEGHVAMVTPANYRELTRGTFSEPRQDGKLLVVDTAVQDADTIKRVDAGELVETSAGYELDYDPTPGVTPDGEHYDGVQRNRVYNHVAALAAGQGRAGGSVGLRFDGAEPATCLDACYDTEVKGNRSDEHPEKPSMKFRFDGKDYDSAEAALAVAGEALTASRAAETAATARADREAARADGKEAELKAAKDPAKIQALVKARVSLDSNARAVLGADYDPDGKSEREIMVDVIRADAAEFKDEGKSPEYLTARYDSVVDRGVRADGVEGTAAAIRKARKDSERTDSADEDTDGIPDVDEAAERSRKDARDAWKKPSRGAAGGAK